MHWTKTVIPQQINSTEISLALLEASSLRSNAEPTPIWASLHLEAPRVLPNLVWLPRKSYFLCLSLKHMDIKLIVSEKPKINTKQPIENNEVKSGGLCIITIEKHETWHNKEVLNVLKIEHINIVPLEHHYHLHPSSYELLEHFDNFLEFHVLINHEHLH